MKKRFLVLFLLIFAVPVIALFFPFLDSIQNVTEATIQNVSGNNFVLTGVVDGGAQHYFGDNSGNSTLQNVEVKKPSSIIEGKKNYYEIVADPLKTSFLLGKKASGWAEVTPTPDMQALIDLGVVYVQATFKLTSNSSNNQSQLKVTLSAGEKQTEVTTSNSKGQTKEYQTEMIKLEGTNNIKFSFTTLEENKVGSCSDFVLAVPTIKFFTILEDFYFENTNATLAPGQTIKLLAGNDIVNYGGSEKGNFLSISQINHEIKYEIESTGNCATIIRNELSISKDAPNGAVITVKATCKKNSLTDEYFDYKEVSFTINADKIEVFVVTDFEESQPGNFDGVGEYDINDKISISVTPNQGFEFVEWQVIENGEIIQTSTRRNLLYTVLPGQTVYAKFVKDVQIISLGATPKYYDGKDTISQDEYICTFKGKEENHDLTLDGITLRYASKDVGENKALILEGYETLTLGGKDKDLYNLVFPTGTMDFAVLSGTIYKQKLEVGVESTTKIYGETDPQYQGILMSGKVADAENLSDILKNSFTRVEGEDVGEYEILPVYNDDGLTLNSDNNYQVFYVQQECSKLEITQREVVLKNIIVSNKVYDGTLEANVTDYKIQNKLENDDLEAEITAQFESKDAGVGITVNVISAKLVGEDAENYRLIEDYEVLSANIDKKSIIVSAKETQFTYGDDIVLSYEVEGLVAGESSLNGQLSIDNKNVGVHNISIGDLSESNPNYQIEFKSASCTINRKEITVTVDKGQSKVYGDTDPVFTYQVEGFVGNDVLQGALTRFDLGNENVGAYDILQGSLTDNNNPNYKITYIGSVFEIVKRDVEINIQFLDKQYNGTTKVEYDKNIIISNQPASQNIELEIEAVLDGVNVGTRQVNANISILNADERNIDYTINYNKNIVVNRRDVTILIDNKNKIYGEIDPNITFTVENMVEGENLEGSILRNLGDGNREGENVGKYSYYLGTLNNENNPNYNIKLGNQAFLTINPKQIFVTSQNYEKVFGDSDPEFIANISDDFFEFDDTFETIISGSLSREEGENVGIYNLTLGTLTANSNYSLAFEEEYILIINKKDIVVRAQNAEKIYGEEDPVFKYDVEGDIPGQEVNMEIKRLSGEDVGTYEMVQGSFSDPRYNITFIPAKLTIIPADITIKADDKFKYYRDEDPYFNVVITNGFLKNNDILSNILTGTMTREDGENVGSYQIYQGSISLGENYNITFENGILEIVPLTVEIVSDNIFKYYGDSDPKITYHISEGQIYPEDVVSGELSRESGESIGSYKTTLGSLKINDNYNIKFVEGEFVIQKRILNIVPTVVSKIYGEEDPVIEYKIIGSLVGDDVLEGELYREKPTTSSNPYLFENVGKYKIYSTLQNENYEILFDNYYFEILKRKIEIQADNKVMIYGQEEPELTYKVVSGTILEGDELSGELYRVPGTDVGKYDIRSSLTLGSNYKIIFEKGTFTINPIKLTIESKNYQKTYGQYDPEFEYQIVEGNLLEDDILYGSIDREEGEDVGTYALINNLTNPNYEISLKSAFLTIIPKDVYLLAQVHDKAYDGTTKAYIKTPVVSGLLDKEVYLSYDKENCAYFEDAQVGDNKQVYFYDIILEGKKAMNYHLILPTDVKGSITYDELQNKEISISSPNDANLYYGSTLEYKTFDISRSEMGLNIQQVLIGYEIWLEKNSTLTDINTSVTITINIPEEFINRNNIYVYHKNEKGEYTLISSRRNEAGQVVFTTDELGEFVIMTDNDKWIDSAAGICAVILFVILVLSIALYIKRKTEKMKQ